MLPFIDTLYNVIFSENIGLVTIVKNDIQPFSPYYAASLALSSACEWTKNKKLIEIWNLFDHVLCGM